MAGRSRLETPLTKGDRIGAVTRPPVPKVVSRAPALMRQRSSKASIRGRNTGREIREIGLRRALRADENHMEKSPLSDGPQYNGENRTSGARTERWSLFSPLYCGP